MQCIYHLCKNELTGKRKKYCSNTCKTKSQITQWRHRVKRKAIAYMGGCCSSCGYNKCSSALEFHHKDPAQKDFGISQNGNCVSWEKTKVELDKCIMLCSNCHRELHEKLAGAARLERATRLLT